MFDFFDIGGGCCIIGSWGGWLWCMGELWGEEIFGEWFCEEEEVWGGEFWEEDEILELDEILRIGEELGELGELILFCEELIGRWDRVMNIKIC